jgi:hypothetical protein
MYLAYDLYYIQIRDFLNLPKLNLFCILLLTFIAVAMKSSPVVAQSGCEYLDRYLAPLESPVENWQTALAGPPAGEVQQRLVGPEECRIVEERIIHNAHGVPYRQVTIGITGTVFGFAPVNTTVLPPLGIGEEGEGRENTFSDHVFILQSRGNKGPYIPGIAHYQYTEENPSSIVILIPQNAADWNGSMYVLVHGASRFGRLRFHPRQPDEFNRYTQTGLQAGTMIDKGFAVVWTRRDAASFIEENSLDVSNTVLLDDGTELGGPGKIGMGLNNHLGLIRDWTMISHNFIEEQLGKAPEYKFFRGHSAGAALGRSYQVIDGMNIDHSGNELIDGLFLSDTAAGLGASAYFWEAVVIDELGTFRLQPTNQDILTFDSDRKRRMIPTIEVIHAEYAGSATSTLPHLFERVPGTYFEYKLENTRINIEKGLGDIWKSYVIAGTSHSDASAESFDYPDLAKDMVDIGGVEVALHDALYDWVRNGKRPPHTRIDAVDVWDIDPDAGPAIQLPETACPRGIYRPYMNRPDGTSVGSSPALFVPYLTELVPQINEQMARPPGFKEEWLEPLDANGYLVDMTNSRHRMTRPTIQQVWHKRYKEGKKTGILRPNEILTRDRYVACVTDVATSLYADGLLTEEALTWHKERAETDDIGVD